MQSSAVYSSAAPVERAALHRKLAEVVADLEERGRHLALAADQPDAEIADIVEAAAERARARGAPDAAAELYEQAAELTLPDDVSVRHRRTISAAEARLQAGDVSAARLSFAQAVETAPDSEARAYALTRLGAMLVLDWQHDLYGALETYGRARQEAARNPALLAAIEHDLAFLAYFRGDRSGASVHARQAVGLAEQIGDETRLAYALVALALLEGRGGGDEAVALLERAFRHEHRLEEAHFAARPQSVQALFVAGDGRLDEARAISLDEHHRALERGDESSLPTVLEHLTMIERFAGNWEDAERYARDMHAAAERGGFMAVYHSSPYALILALRGRVDEARALAEQGLEVVDGAGIGRTFGGHRAVLGFIELSLGNVGACARRLEPLSETLTSEIGETGWFRFLADEIEARVTLGELERAHELLERLAERRIVLLDRAWARAATERCRGLVLAAGGDEPGAMDAFARALAEHEQLGDPFELARTLLARGRAERRFRRRRAARETLTRAREIFDGLGAPLWVERTDDDLSRIGGRSPREPGLTATEAKVAQLAAVGRTNRQIGAELFISENTVETHLKRIYREFGVRSRTELAGKLLDRAE